MGTSGSVRLRPPAEACTLAAMANVLWKITFTISILNVPGSAVVASQEIDNGPPLMALSGVLSVSADARGRARAAKALRRWLTTHQKLLADPNNEQGTYPSLANMLKS